MQLNNVSLSLVNTILNINPSNDDSIILVLGALARNSNVTTQKVVVDELLKRLSMAITSKNSTQTRLAPNMLKNLPIIPSQASQNFYLLFFFNSHSTTKYFLFYCVNDNITLQE